MTLKEAIFTGKDFKRPDGDFIKNTYDPEAKLFDELYQLGLTMADVLADDWLTRDIIEVTLTEKVFNAACDRARSKVSINSTFTAFADLIKKELGF